MPFKFSLNLPITLTLVRLVVSPILMPALLVWLLPSSSLIITCFLAGIFVLLGATDFLDGYLARKYQQETMLGKLLDPVADKMLVFSTALALIAVGKLWLYWAIIVIGRDLFVMGLREVALSSGFSVSVSWVGKWKTVAQLIYLAVVIANPSMLFSQAPALYLLQLSLFVISLIMTIYSAYNYYKLFAAGYAALGRRGF
jgi:cardiolipin synthase